MGVISCNYVLFSVVHIEVLMTWFGGFGVDFDCVLYIEKLKLNPAGDLGCICFDPAGR